MNLSIVILEFICFLGVPHNVLTRFEDAFSVPLVPVYKKKLFS